MDRKKFMKRMSAGAAGIIISANTPGLLNAAPWTSQVHDTFHAKFSTDVFLYGASVYPELQTKAEQIKMLDLFQKGGFTVLRVGESSWGNLETAPGKFNFGWLREFLDEMHKRGIRAILGTCSYTPPQWLAAKHPEILWKYPEGDHANPMGRHAASRNHPLFRAELKKFILAYGGTFKNHPAVIGWQLDNEIEWNILRVDYNPAHQKAWTDWLKKTYGSIDELNRRLDLKAWGLQTDAFEYVPQPSKSNDGGLPALYLANLHFERDNIMDYFRWQKALLRESGVKQWITTDYVMITDTIADQPQSTNPIDISGLNQYQPTEDNPEYWASQAMFNNIHRCINDNGRFLVMETRIGPTGNTKIENPAPSRRQFFMWIVEPAAFGANCVMHWSGNRYVGGHWPHWGGMLDWSGHPEPDFEWATEIAAFYKKWGANLISNTVMAKAAVLTDFDQRAALKTYPHTAGSNKLLAEAFDAFHRNGIGVDAINSSRAGSYENIKNYQVLVIAAAPCLDADKLNPALRQFVAGGGVLIITPYTGYQTWDGVFLKTGFASDLSGLTGTLTRTLRLIGQPDDKNGQRNMVVWEGDYALNTCEIGMNGFTEILELEQEASVIAHFSTREEVMNKKPAATLKKIGKGSVIKLAFWPAQNDFTQLVQHITRKENPYLKGILPAGVQAVPRTDNSFFIINTLNQSTNISLVKSMTDRISGTARNVDLSLAPYEILWLA